jgi:hypothetical protein
VLRKADHDIIPDFGAAAAAAAAPLLVCVHRFP